MFRALLARCFALVGLHRARVAGGLLEVERDSVGLGADREEVLSLSTRREVLSIITIYGQYS